MKLTKNFRKSEFNCKCGCEMPVSVLENIKTLSKQLQVLRNQTNKSIKVNSGYRCSIHNELIGGSENSQHKLGKAADVVITDFSPFETYSLISKFIKIKLMKKGGLGKYNSFTHYDIREVNARWDFTK